MYIKLEEDIPTTASTIYPTIFVLGIGVLLPFYAFISASSYFERRLCSSNYHSSFENAFSFGYNFSQPFGLYLSLFYGQKVSIMTQVRIPFILYSIIFTMITITVIIDIEANTLFWINFFGILCCGFLGAILNGGLFAITATLPSHYTSSLMIGGASAGLLVALGSFLTVISTLDSSCDTQSNEDDNCKAYSFDYGSFIYFLLSTIVLYLCIVLFEYLIRHPFYVKSTSLSQKNTNYFDEETKTDITSSIMTLTEDSLNEPTSSSFMEIIRLLRLISIPSFSVFFTYAISLSIFPAIIVLIEPQDPCSSSKSQNIFNKMFTPFLFTLWNVCDVIGRFSAEQLKDWDQFPINAANIHYFAISRLLLLIALLFCNLKDSVLEKVFISDAIPMVLIILLACSNGLIANLSMMFGPSLVPVTDQSKAGIIMIFSLTIGLLTGSLFSFICLYSIHGYF